jgi:hypothetical protein
VSQGAGLARRLAASRIGRGGCGWWERLPAAIRRRVAREARLIDDLQRISPPATLTGDAEVSRRQAVIMSPGRPFQLTSHDASYLELALRTGSTLAGKRGQENGDRFINLSPFPASSPFPAVGNESAYSPMQESVPCSRSGGGMWARSVDYGP